MSDVGFMFTENYNYQNREDDVIVEKFSEKKTGESDGKLKIVKIVFFILFLVFVAELVIYRWVLPSFSNPKVNVKGLKTYTAEEIVSKFVPLNCSNWFDFDVEQAVSILSSEPGIDSVSIEKKFPNMIYVNLSERVPVAVTFIEENGTSNPIQIDKTGVLFPLKDASVLQTSKIPIISGLPIDHMTGGMRIPPKYRPLIDQIAKIGEDKTNYFASISEICVIPKEFGNYELALIPSQSKIKVLTDRSLNQDALKYMMVVLDVVNLLDTEVSEVDLRYGSVSCRMK